MVPPKPLQPRSISVGKCHVQTANDRFGDQAERAIKDRERVSIGLSHQGYETPYTWPGLDDDEKSADTSIYRRVPSVQNARNNLTALSQGHSLYFAAYQGRIFVYALRGGPRNSIPQQPDLRLKPPVSLEGTYVGGYLDRRQGHLINHLITGFLGEEEIVLACHDNGDVVAYSITAIADCVLRRPPNLRDRTGLEKDGKDAARTRGRPVPRPFFHQNVRKSAWGLAIHKKSRLIAVSSNTREVTVFALAVSSPPSRPGTESNVFEPIEDLESRVRQRLRNWRIVISMGARSDNIPNICFMENEDGSAEKVCAIDIKGSVWIADIWRPSQPITRIPPFKTVDYTSQEFYSDVSRGWGILAFRESAFMKVKTLEELVGPAAQMCSITEHPEPTNPPMVHIETCLEDIPDNPCPPSTARVRPTGRRNHLTIYNQMMLEGFTNLNAIMDGNVQIVVNNTNPNAFNPWDPNNTNPPIFPATAEVVAADVDGTWNMDDMDMDDEDDDFEETGDLEDEEEDEYVDDEEDEDDDEGGDAENEAAALAQILINELTPTQTPTQPPTQLPHDPYAQPPAHLHAQLNAHFQTHLQGPLTQPQTSPHTTPPTWTPIFQQNFPQTQPTTQPTIQATPQPQTQPMVAATDQLTTQATPQPPAQGQTAPGGLPAVQNPVFQSAFTTLGTALSELEEAVGYFENAITTPGLTPPSNSQRHHQARCLCHKCRVARYGELPNPSDTNAQIDILEEGQRLDMIYYPQIAEVAPAPMKQKSRIMSVEMPEIRYSLNVLVASQIEDRSMPGYCLLRTYEKDFEMWRLPGGKGYQKTKETEEVGMSCTNAMTCNVFADRNLLRLFRASSRLNLLAHIPELSLVALGSPTGRVLLLTLTRMASPRKELKGRGELEWDHGLRTEWVLPNKSDEAAHRKNPRPLYGMALGRIPDTMTMTEKGEKIALPPRFRLMLHYSSHDILSYEISRDERTGKLWVF